MKMYTFINFHALVEKLCPIQNLTKVMCSPSLIFHMWHSYHCGDEYACDKAAYSAREMASKVSLPGRQDYR